MTMQKIREVQTPYLVKSEDEAIGKATIFIKQNGEPIAVIVPYAEYQQWQTHKVSLFAYSLEDREFEKQWEAFQRLKPDLLKTHEGHWVGIVRERVAAVGDSSNAVLEKILDEYGDVPMYIQEVRAEPRVYQMTGRTIISRYPSEGTA